MKGPTTTLLVPVFNERAALPATLEALAAFVAHEPDRYELLFVDDGSLDGSTALLRGAVAGWESARLIELGVHRGFYEALRQGFEACRTPAVVTLEAHLQHDLMVIPRLLDELARGHELVGAQRVRRRDPVLRRVGSTLVNRSLRGLLGMPLQDVHCLLKAWDISFARRAFARATALDNLHHLANARATNVAVDWSRARVGATAFGLPRLAATALTLLGGALWWRIRAAREPDAERRSPRSVDHG